MSVDTVSKLHKLQIRGPLGRVTGEVSLTVHKSKIMCLCYNMA